MAYPNRDRDEKGDSCGILRSTHTKRVRRTMTKCYYMLRLDFFPPPKLELELWSVGSL